MEEPTCAQDTVGARKGHGRETKWLCQGHRETQVDLGTPLPPDTSRSLSALKGAWVVLQKSPEALAEFTEPLLHAQHHEGL